MSHAVSRRRVRQGEGPRDPGGAVASRVWRRASRGAVRTYEEVEVREPSQYEEAGPAKQEPCCHAGTTTRLIKQRSWPDREVRSKYYAGNGLVTHEWLCVLGSRLYVVVVPVLPEPDVIVRIAFMSVVPECQRRPGRIRAGDVVL